MSCASAVPPASSEYHASPVSLEDVVIKVSVGIGRNMGEAEAALSRAKAKKKEGRYYNIETYEGMPLSCDAPYESQAVRSYLRLEQKLEEQGDIAGLCDLENLKYDLKTGLLNRMGYEVEVLKLKNRGAYTDRVIILIDGDDMKGANSRLGYEGTDRYLACIGSALKGQVRQRDDSDRKARNVDILINRKNDSGGDEFIVDIGCDVRFAEGIARRYVHAIYQEQAGLGR
jgi:GGDEF domain-containing protein